MSTLMSIVGALTLIVLSPFIFVLCILLIFLIVGGFIAIILHFIDIFN